MTEEERERVKRLEALQAQRMEAVNVASKRAVASALASTGLPSAKPPPVELRATIIVAIEKLSEDVRMREGELARVREAISGLQVVMADLEGGRR
jgi:hypothetical protein